MLFDEVPLLRQVRAGGERTAVQHELAEVILRREDGEEDRTWGFDGETLGLRRPWIFWRSVRLLPDALLSVSSAGTRFGEQGLAGVVQEVSVLEAVAHGPCRG